MKPPKKPSRNDGGRAPRDDSPRGRGTPPRDESPRGRGSAPRDESPRGRGSAPRDESPRGRGSAPRDDSPRGRGTPPRDDSSRGRGTAPRDDSSSGRGSAPRDDSPRGRGAAPRNDNPRVPRGDAPRPPAPRRDDDRKSPHSPQDFFVDGLSALTEYARFKPASILSVEATPQQKSTVESVLAEHGVEVPVRELLRDPTSAEFAPVRARVRIKALENEAFERRIAERSAPDFKNVIVALDHITDPRNLGAIVRSAAFFGVREVIAPERRQVLFTQASVATAQGGFALTDLVCVVNLSRALDELKEKGYWIIGTAMDGRPYTELTGKYEKIVLVLGSEDTGMAQKVRERCDLLAAIPGGRSQAPTLDSLNVSVAAGIFLSAFCNA